MPRVRKPDPLGQPLPRFRETLRGKSGGMKLFYRAAFSAAFLFWVPLARGWRQEAGSTKHGLVIYCFFFPTSCLLLLASCFLSFAYAADAPDLCEARARSH